MTAKVKLGLACSYSSFLYADFDYSRGVYTKAPSFDELVDQINKAHELGYTGVELETLTREQLHKIFTPKNISKLREFCESLGLEVPLFYGQFAHHRIQTRKEARRDFEDICHAASGLGAHIVGVLSPVLDGVEVTKFGYKGGAATEVTVHHPRASWREQWERYVSAISEYADMASSFQLKVAIEPRPYDVVNNTERSLLLLDEVSQKNLGINFDTAHLFVQKEVLEVSIEKLGQRIFVVHISDNDGQTDYHWAPGKGKIDWRSVLSAFRAIGHTGYLNIEIYGVENVVDEYLNGRKYIENLARSVWQK